MKSKIKIFKSIFFWIVVSISFILTATYLVILASGYRINPQAQRLEKTVLLRIVSNPSEAIVFLNGKPLENKTPIRETGVIPEFYDIKVEKASYNSWSKSFQARAGRAYDFNNVVIFLAEPEIQELDDTQAASFNPILNSDIYFEGGELWFEDELITRLSQDIKYAALYPDRTHLAFQVANEIRIVEFDGRNNTLLVKLTTSDTSLFGFQDENTLIFKDGEKIKQAKIL